VLCCFSRGHRVRDIGASGYCDPVFATRQRDEKHPRPVFHGRATVCRRRLRLRDLRAQGRKTAHCPALLPVAAAANNMKVGVNSCRIRFAAPGQDPLSLP